MKRKMEDWIGQYRHMDWAVLYLRLFIGAIIVLHNIGKVQNYNDIINAYPTFGGLSQATVFAGITVAEVVLSALIMTGLWVRPAAAAMGLGMLLQFAAGWQAGEVQLLYLGIYVFLAIAGPGLYSFDAAAERGRPGKSASGEV